MNTSGQKAHQRADTEDRSLIYREWLRTFEADGFFLDVDMVKFKIVNGTVVPKAITEITRCDRPEISHHYLDAIEQRYFHRDIQGTTIKRLSTLLHVPAYLICYQKELLWMWVYSFQKYKWKQFSCEEWAQYLRGL